MNFDSSQVLQSDLTLIGQGSVLKGEVVFDRFTRVHGKIEGHVQGLPESLIVLGETGTIHGDIHCDEIIIDGLVQGNVHAKGKVTLSESGTLLGDIYAPKVEIKFGAHFEGKAVTKSGSKANPATHTTQPSV